jgi:peptidoglycan-associated lipoprotein
MKKLILSLVLVNLLTACSYFKPKKPAEKPNAEPVVTAPAETPAATEPATVGNATTPDVNAQALEKPAAETPAKTEAAEATTPAENIAAILPKNSVHFPFDVDAIQDSDKEIIQAHGAYLSEHSDRKARTEGNADERGSSEYNLALGQRRANNTKKALVLSGAKAAQIEAISYGEEKPQATGHDEASWAQNRRVDITYK